MQEIAQGKYSKEEIIKMLHSPSRIVKFRYDLLDRNDKKIGELDSVISGEVSMNSLATNSKRVGNFRIREDKNIDWLNDRIQPFCMFKMPDNEWIEYSMGIFLLSSPTKREENGNIYRDVESYDGLKVLLDDRFDKRYVIQEKSSYLKAITDILLEAGITKINIAETDLMLRTTKEFEIGTEKLRVINELLQEINYTSLWVDENGYYTAKPYILPNEREIEYTYADDKLSIMYPGIEEELDLFNVPNKFIVVASNPERSPLVSRYENINPKSLTSIPSRERVIVDYREVDDIANQEALDEYTKRIAYEASQVFGYVNFNTTIMPFHSYSDLLEIKNSILGIEANYVETRWRMKLKAGTQMEHTARRVIQI